MEEEKKVEPLNMLNAEDFLSVHGDINAAAASEVLEEEDCLVIDNEVDFPENSMEISQNVNHLFDDIDEREYEGGNSKRIEDLKTKGEQSVEEMRPKIISLEDTNNQLYQRIEALEHDLTQERQKNQTLEYYLTQERYFKEATEYHLMQERHHKQATENYLSQERHHSQALERDLTQERQQKEALEQDMKTVTQDYYNLILENIDLGEKISSDKQTRECKICLSNEATILFQPCNHIPACLDCLMVLQDHKYDCCPICRSVIDKEIILQYS